jgi:hypothetical protein
LKLPIYVLDSETDPFQRYENPQPFAWGFYDGERCVQTWGPNCTRDMMWFLRSVPAGIVYVHNGGKFDFLFLMEYISRHESMNVIKDRIVRCYVHCITGYHELRDSYKILPFALERYQKTKIEYAKFYASSRETYKDEIQKYLKDDCVFLYELVTEYHRTFGNSLTIGGTAMKLLRQHHDIGMRMGPETDAQIRPYFFGGRVERYGTGTFKGNWKVYDVNSMYPYVMCEFLHPIGLPYAFHRGSHAVIDADTCFLTVRGMNKGAFPMRSKEGVRFNGKYGEYKVSIHEWRVAEELQLFELDEIVETVQFSERVRFDVYIDKYYGLRKEARDTGDKIREIFYKFLLNNSYGKFATNPANFKEYVLRNAGENPGNEYELYIYMKDFGIAIWQKPATDVEYYNIATGASITGAARSVLLRGLHRAKRAMYCDTDCIICESLDANLDKSLLGAWKLEAEGDQLDLVARKIYALTRKGECVKFACKGAVLTPEEIHRAAAGEQVTYYRDAPTYRMLGSKTEWLKRKIKSV